MKGAFGPTAVVAWRTLSRSRRGPLGVGLWSLFALAAAFYARGHAHGADQAASALGSTALPLLAYAAVGATLGSTGLRRASAPLVSFGEPPWRAAAGPLVLSMAVSAVLGLVLGAAAVALAHGPLDPPLAHDVATAALSSFTGGACYTALFVFGASLDARGLGRPALLVVDALLGPLGGPLSVVTPRAHLASLLGGHAVLGLSPRASFASLGLLTVLFSLASLRRARH